MSVNTTEINTDQQEVSFRKTDSGHEISFNPDNAALVPAALVMAAFKKAKVAPLEFASGYSNYKSDIKPKRALELVSETADEESGLLFFLDYVHGKTVQIGAKQNQDGTVTLVDRLGKPIPEIKAQTIAEFANYCVDEVREQLESDKS